ncbi:MAG: polysaccharide deacetylase family protein [Bacteroides sp.]|nr:polysaccharide deacetylase family protein [Bacteroides sp.]
MKKIKLILVSLISVSLLAACSGGTETENTENTDNDITVTEPEGDETTEESEENSVPVPITYDIDPTKPVIALTFDDGPNTTTTNEVLDMLEKYHVRASFFLIGNNINDESAKAVKRAYDLGCEINNHSRTHSYMNEMSAEDIREEAAFVSDKVKEITGEPTVFFRPPYIAVNDTMYDNIDMPFISGIGCNDWDDSVDADTRVKRLQRQIRDGVIILLHDAEGNSKTVEALDTLIPYLLDKGYQFATVSELFEAKGVEISGDDTNLYNDVQAAE